MFSIELFRLVVVLVGLSLICNFNCNSIKKFWHVYTELKVESPDLREREFGYWLQINPECKQSEQNIWWSDQRAISTFWHKIHYAWDECTVYGVRMRFSCIQHSSNIKYVCIIILIHRNNVESEAKPHNLRDYRKFIVRFLLFQPSYGFIAGPKSNVCENHKC